MSLSRPESIRLQVLAERLEQAAVAREEADRKLTAIRVEFVDYIESLKCTENQGERNLPNE